MNNVTVLMAGIVTLQTSSGSRCGWNGNCQRLFSAAHAFSWILIVTCEPSYFLSSFVSDAACFQCFQLHMPLTVGPSPCTEPSWSALRHRPWFLHGIFPVLQTMRGPSVKGS
ncbi:hypothetical protein B0H14DRAFT_170125 [Mycena olivaceomarginata]|nr:hypothetical protein B0H14DRAFT_170125 [Mycena olivaceomarginata]